MPACNNANFFGYSASTCTPLGPEHAVQHAVCHGMLQALPQGGVV